MRFFTKKTDTAPTDPTSPDAMSTDTAPAAPAQAAKWTNGSHLGSKGATILVVALIACGPAALVVGLHASSSSAAAPQTEHTTQASPLQQSAGSFAEGYVGAWLSASQDDSAALEDYTTVNVPQLPKNGFAYRDIAIASVTTDDAANLIQVVVAANMKDSTVDAAKGDQWPRRYYQVVVSSTRDKLAAIGLPAQVTGPQHSTDAPSTAYGQSIASSSSAGKTVTAFFAAYLTGQGETEPYTAPSTSIPPIKPAPFSDLTVGSIEGVAQPDEHPADGATVQVYVTLTASNSLEQTSTSTYTLTLRARADRWEVAAIGAPPALTGSTEPTSHPTSTPSKGN